ncbi:MAG: phosphoribosylformylglycinamidine cyclo-ligase [Chitinophagales bacterium]|nr:phosphoribosylformylglycinamidine cyclo-ligase [Chitinophagales bacterium]
MQDDPLKYDLRGVSASKDDVHKAIEHLDKGLFPNAFCKVMPDIVGGDAAYCNVMHADTAGTKTSLAYMYWKETGDIDVWKGIVEDAIVMNLDDMGCVGIFDNIVLSSTIGRNRNLITGEVISTIINYAQEYIEKLADYGVHVHLAGGETADVGDIVRTIDVGYTAFARIKRSEIVDIRIQPGDYIVGFASYGQSVYENEYNGGMGSNGLTSSRHDVLDKYYMHQYPDSFNPHIPESVVYTGSRRLTDTIDIDGKAVSVGKLILSPTRTYLPLLKPMIESFRESIHGLIHCSGGGQTKVGKFVRSNIAIIKDALLPIPPLFKLIQEESGLSNREMFQVFNMGHRLECYTPDIDAAHAMIAMAEKLGIKAAIIGRVVAADKPQVIVEHNGEKIVYPV